MRITALLLGAVLLAAPAASRAQLVALELSLVVDVSGSISASEFDLRRQGYADGFASASLQDAILSSAGGRIGAIAVNLVFWAGLGQQTEVAGWTLLDSADAFAAALFEANTITSARQVIDGSGDGATNDGIDTATARDAALAAGVDSTNGFVILGEEGVQDFYANNVVGGAGQFLRSAAGFEVFGDAIADKLAFEIGGTVPGPATYGAIGAAVLCGLALWRRRSTNVPA